mmetsp:Transcript_85215/g.169053  ORF Transcript_85215/g.169053 Transcript_85215/m.169053 type:complete len:95 (-) Transcript_85215:70-354(-)
MDPVVQLPPSSLVSNWHYQHVEPEVFYNGNVEDGHVSCALDGDQQCSGMYSNILYDLLHVDDHLKYVGVDTATAGCKELARDVNASVPSSVIVI